MIIYHSIDADGYFSAALIKLDRKNEELVPVNYTDWEDTYQTIVKALQSVNPPKCIYIVDICFPQTMFEEIVALAMQVNVPIIWIDHHKSSMVLFPSLPGKRSIHASAARLVTEYFTFLSEYDDDVVQLVSDYDTWNFNDDDPLLAKPAVFNSGFMNAREEPNKMVERAISVLTGSFILKESVIAEGFLVLKGQLARAKELVKEAVFGKLATGHTYSMINATELNPGYICKYFYETHDFAFIWSVIKGRRVMIQFRSGKRNGMDVGEYAKEFGGGGHKHAAGATMSLEEFNKHFLCV